MAPPHIPARVWLRPALVLLGGALFAILLWLIGQRVGAVAAAALTLFLAYWTAPIRRGDHTPFATAMEQVADDHAVILWAPGDPLSSRLQAAIRGRRSDVTWVNVYQDTEAQAFLLAHGGRACLPLVIIGARVLTHATVGHYLDARAEGQQRAAG